jgi:hypothetical protein
MDRYYYWNPPLYFLFLAPIVKVASPHDYLLTIRLASWGLGAVFLILSALILRRISGSPWLTCATLMLLGTHITFIRAANLGRMEMLTLVCGAASVAAYLRGVDLGARRWWAVAGLAGGLACVSHPAGAFIFAALVLHQLVTLGPRFFRERRELLFLGAAAGPLVAWLVYAAQAPHIFASQLGGQFVRKAAGATVPFSPHGVLAKILYPVQFGPMPMPVVSHDWGFLVIVLVVTTLCITQVRGQGWLRIIEFWALSGLALNLLVHEVWYPVYFVLPVVLLLGGCAAAARNRPARTIAVTVIAAGILGNVLQISILHGNEYLTWEEYRNYCSTIVAQIPSGSSVLLAAIPDPYFGMLAEGKAYRFHEFVPVAVPVDPAMAEGTLNSVDYMVESGCCRRAYLERYVRAHGTLVSEFGVPGHAWPDVRIWRLRKP